MALAATDRPHVMRHIAETTSRPPWAEYRRLRRLYWFAWLAYVPIVGLIGVALWGAFGGGAAFPTMAVALASRVFAGVNERFDRALPMPALRQSLPRWQDDELLLQAVPLLRASDVGRAATGRRRRITIRWSGPACKLFSKA